MRQSSRSQIHRTNLRQSLRYLKLDSLINAFPKVLNNIIFTLNKKDPLNKNFRLVDNGRWQRTTNESRIKNGGWLLK